MASPFSRYIGYEASAKKSLSRSNVSVCSIRSNAIKVAHSVHLAAIVLSLTGDEKGLDKEGCDRMPLCYG